MVKNRVKDCFFIGNLGIPAVDINIEFASQAVGNDIEAVKEFLRGKTTGASSLEKVLGMIERNEVDLVALGRPILADPEWVAKVESKRVDELQPVPKDAGERLY